MRDNSHSCARRQEGLSVTHTQTLPARGIVFCFSGLFWGRRENDYFFLGDTGGGRGKSSKMSPDVADDVGALFVVIVSPKDDRRRRIDKGLCGIGCGG